MNPLSRKPSGGCRQFERNLYHFQAGELSEAERRAVEDHADACAPCAERMAIEDGFLRALRARLCRAEAPPGLRDRVCRALDREAVPATFASWLRAPWLIPVAAAVVLALVLVPALPGWNAGAGAVPVERDVTVVDLTCDGAGMTLEQQRLCPDPNHLNALKLSSGGYWNISLDDARSRRLVVDRAMRGHRLHVKGDYYATISTLHLTSFTDRGEEQMAALFNVPDR